MNIKTVGYKAMNTNMTCRGFQFEVGKSYHVGNDKPLKLCSDSGFHFCKRFDDIFEFYKWNRCRIFKVETSSPVVTNGQMSITKEITILSEVTREDLDYEKLKSSISKYYYKYLLEPNEQKLCNVFKDHNDLQIRETIVQKLTDEQLILKFKGDTHWIVRRAIVNKLNNEQLIFENFKDDSDYDVRKALLNKLKDKNLISAFKVDPHPLIRDTAKLKLENK